MLRRPTPLSAVAVVMSLLLVGSIVRARVGLVLDDRQMSSLRGADCGTCDVDQSCQSCTGSNGNFMMCTNGGMNYTECALSTDPNKTCGTCTRMEADCGDMLIYNSEFGCSGNSQNQGHCSGCNSVLGPTPC